MNASASTSIRRRADGSIDIDFYRTAGCQARADEAHHLWADITRPAIVDRPRAAWKRLLGVVR